MICEYNRCNEEVFEDSNTCILHYKLPSIDNPDYSRIRELKVGKFKEKLEQENYNFTGINIADLKLEDKEFLTDLNFDKAIITGDINLSNVFMHAKINFDYAKIYGELIVRKECKIKNLHLDKIFIAKRILISNSNVNFISISGDYYNPIIKHVRLNKVKEYFLKYKIINDSKNYFLERFKKHLNLLDNNYAVKTGIDINKSNFNVISIDRLNIGSVNEGGIFIEQSKVSEYIQFWECDIKNDIWIRRVEIDSELNFFSSRIEGGFFYELSTVGNLFIDKVVFTKSHAQETASREAKRIYENLGDRTKADDCFFHEMEAKRKQKSRVIRLLEKIFVQWMMGYGTKPLYVLFSVVILSIVMAGIYSILNSIIVNSQWDYLYFSITNVAKTSIDNNFSLNQNKELTTIVYLLQTIFATFLWGAFIATMSRKYMK